MENVYNHASGAIKRTDCALHQCVRVIPVPAWMLKLGTHFKVLQEKSEESDCTLFYTVAYIYSPVCIMQIYLYIVYIHVCAYRYIYVIHTHRGKM